MKVEYRNLPHDSGKVSTIGIGAGSLHKAAPQEIKNISPSSHDDSSVHTVCSSGSSCSILDGPAVQVET